MCLMTIPPPSPGADQQAVIALLKRLAPHEGYTLTALPDVRLLRSNRPLARTPVMYEPGIVIVCQGRKHGFLGDQEIVYDAQHYLAVSVPVPFSMQTDASAATPLLAIYLRLDLALAAELMLELDGHGGAPPAEARGLLSTPMDAAMTRSVLRLLDALADPLELALLGRQLVREIYFRVLAGEQGAAMRAALNQQGPTAKIAKALRRIHAAYAQPLGVDALALEAGMSVAAFHAHFKAITAISPLQYIKSTRLHQARLLMLREGMTAAAAAAEVGYESASQFSREFKRLFGRPPAQEVAHMQDGFARPPTSAASIYVTSH